MFCSFIISTNKTTNAVQSTTIAAKTTPVPRNNLNLELLIVVDSGTYDFFVNLYGNNLTDAIIIDYIKMFCTQLVNGVNFIPNLK